MTDTQGTRLRMTARMASVPCRIVPPRSASRPIMKPGSSTKLTTGRWNWLHSSAKRRTFCAPLGGHRACVVASIVTEHADRMSCETGEPGDLTRAEAPRHFEPGSVVQNQADQAAHVERLPPVARHDVEKRFFDAPGIVRAGRRRGQLPDVRGQVAEEGPDWANASPRPRRGCGRPRSGGGRPARRAPPWRAARPPPARRGPALRRGPGSSWS